MISHCANITQHNPDWTMAVQFLRIIHQRIDNQTFLKRTQMTPATSKLFMRTKLWPFHSTWGNSPRIRRLLGFWKGHSWFLSPCFRSAASHWVTFMHYGTVRNAVGMTGNRGWERERGGREPRRLSSGTSVPCLNPGRRSKQAQVQGGVGWGMRFSKWRQCHSRGQ